MLVNSGKFAVAIWSIANRNVFQFLSKSAGVMVTVAAFGRSRLFFNLVSRHDGHVLEDRVRSKWNGEKKVDRKSISIINTFRD